MLYYIYKIFCKDLPNDLYVGSTKNFRDRIRTHKSKCYNENDKEYNKNLYQVIRANGGWENWNIEIIKELEVESKDDAEIVEEEYRIKLQANLNTLRCFRTHEERLEQSRESAKNWNENHKEQRREYEKKWREEHREQIIEYSSIKCDCDCGGKYTMQNKARHLKTNKHQKYLNENKIFAN